MCLWSVEQDQFIGWLAKHRSIDILYGVQHLPIWKKLVFCLFLRDINAEKEVNMVTFIIIKFEDRFIIQYKKPNVW